MQKLFTQLKLIQFKSNLKSNYNSSSSPILKLNFGFNNMRFLFGNIGFLAFFSVLFLLLSFSSLSYAQTAVGDKARLSASGLSIGIVNNQKILSSVPDAITARKNIEKEIKAIQDDLLAQKDEIEKLNKELIEKEALLTAEAKTQRQTTLQQKVMELRQKEFTSQQEIRQKEASITQEIVRKIAEVVQKLAKEKNLDMVFETNQSGIMYLKEYVDITDDVIVEYNKAFSAVSSTDKSKKQGINTASSKTKSSN